MVDVTNGGPGLEAVSVTPHDSNALAKPSRALWIGGSGDVTVDMVNGGENITFSGAPVGVFPFSVTRVYATGTTATNILAIN